MLAPVAVPVVAVADAVDVGAWRPFPSDAR